MKKTITLYLEIIFVLGLPLILMDGNPFFLAIRPILLAIGGIYCGLILWKSGAKLSDIGITKHNFWPSLRGLVNPSIFIVAITIALLIAVPSSLRLWLIGQDPLSLPSLWMRIIFYMFASAPVQELIFRGYFTYRLERVFSMKRIMSILSVVVFTFSHVPFKSPIMLGVALMLGIVYISNYFKYKNLATVTISHALVGAVLILVRNFYLPYT